MASRSEQKDTKSSKAHGTRKASPSNKDQLWKDMLLHERQLLKLWHWKWDFLLQPEFCSSSEKDQQDSTKSYGASLRESTGMKSAFPIKSSEWIGLIDESPSYALDRYLMRPSLPPKIRFQDEQYGKYRQLKYLMSSDQDEEKPSIIPPKIRHTVKPLLC